ncbi:hypothetical protein PMAYCL1PPCAC_06880, partial [Pristionchus mayeri]
VIVLNSTTSDITQVKEEVYDRIDRSMITEVNLETEDPLTPNQIMDHVINTVLLIKHFISDEMDRGKGSPFTYVVFISTHKIMRIMVQEIKQITMNTNIELLIFRTNRDIKCAREMNGRQIVLLLESAEDAFVLDKINIVIDMGLTSWKSNLSSIGSNRVRTIWADRARMIRRANLVERGTVAYPFDSARLQWMRVRSISKFPGYDLEMRYFHDSKGWSYVLSDERTDSFMKKAEDISIRNGLISCNDPRYCTPVGSFCSAVLPSLPPQLAKLVLCGIVCGCEDGAVALATILSEDGIVFECSRRMSSLMECVKVGVRSEHLALLHAYDRRYCSSGLFSTHYNKVKNMEKREVLLRSRIKKNSERVGLGKFSDDEEVEKRLLLALAMAFGDRIGYALIGNDDGETRFFHLEVPDDRDMKCQFETSTKFKAGDEEAGIFYELREKDKEKYCTLTTEVTMVPLSILAAIGNIGGRAEKMEDGLFLTTNSGGLHIQMSSLEHVEEVIDIRNEVWMEVQRVALSCLQSDRYLVQFKTERDKWMDELLPLLTPPTPLPLGCPLQYV